MYKKHQCPQCHVPSYFTIFKYLYENLLLLGKKSGKILKNEKIKNNTCYVHYALVLSMSTFEFIKQLHISDQLLL